MWHRTSSVSLARLEGYLHVGLVAVGRRRRAPLEQRRRGSLLLLGAHQHVLRVGVPSEVTVNKKLDLICRNFV